MKKALGSVGGGVGLLLVLFTAPMTYFTVDSVVPAAISLLLGIAGITLSILTRKDRVEDPWQRSAFFYSSSLGLSVVFVALLFAVNFIAAKRAPSWDLTAKHIFSLSLQTESTLKGLKNPVKVIAFVQEAPPDAVEVLFRRYAAVTERFTFEFKDPRRTPDLARKYQLSEGQPAVVLISQGTPESHTIINLKRLLNPIGAEQELTNGLLKLEAVGEQKLYFVVGHGELPLEPLGTSEEAVMASLSAVRRLLQDEGYAPQALNILERGGIPPDASALVIAGATSKYSEPEVKQLETYLEQGGRLLYFAEAGSEAGLDALLAKYGAQIEPGIVADSKVNADQPYIVYTPFISEHEVTRVLMAQQANVVFATTRGITKLATGTLDSLTLTPLVLTTPYAWIETTISEHPNRDPEERTGQIILGMAVSRPTGGAPSKRTDEARLIIFGDSDLLTGAFGIETNRNLVLNSFAWTTQQMAKITIRPPDRDLSTLELSNSTLSTVRLVSMGLLPTLLLAMGLTIRNLRRAR